MKKQWEKKVDTLISEYDQKILDKLNETGYQDVLSMIEGLQKELSALKKKAFLLSLGRDHY